MPDISLQPKQYELLEEIERGRASWIGVGGGRGAAKSAGIDRTALALLTSQPGIVCAIVMRTAAQVRKYHIEPMLRAFPELTDYYAVQKGKLKLPTGQNVFSEMDIGYAENYNAVENFFRSGNYKYIFIDQAEQFTEQELREIKKACRWPGGGAKLVLSFNMGGIGIGFLRKIFHDKEYNEREDPENYTFLKVNPWDNVFWVMDALKADGFDESAYYSWTDEQRKAYAASRGEYTAQLNAEDDAIRARDWEGSWESLEGAYFGKVFGSHNIINVHQWGELIKPWWKRWMSGDWGSGHYTSVYWHARGEVEPEVANRVLGLEVKTPISAIVTYREWLGNDMAEAEMGEKLLSLSDDQELGKVPYSSIVGIAERVKAFYFSPDAFEMSIKRKGQNMIADELGKVLKRGGLPYPVKANNARVAGWRTMYGLFWNTKQLMVNHEYKGTIALICDNCTELIKAVPLLMRDPKNIEDVFKTDESGVDIAQDAGDGYRYGMMGREARDGEKTQEAKNAEILASLPTPQDRYMRSFTLPKIKPNNFNWRVR